MAWRRWLTARNMWTVALLLSLVLHVTVYSCYRVAKRYHWAGHEKLLRWLMPSPTRHPLPLFLNLAQVLKPKPPPAAKPPEPPRPKEPPMVFVSVDPSQSVPEPPPQAKYYSDKNSLAANPVIKKPSDDPNIEGKQKHVAQTMDVPPTVPKPAPPPPPKKEEPKPEVKETPPQPPPAPNPLAPKPVEVVKESPKPKPAETMGDLAFAKPADKRRTDPGTADSQTRETKPSTPQPLAPTPAQPEQPHKRPMRVAEAKLAKNMVPGLAIDQEGGNRRLAMAPSFDARMTPFGAYDAAIVYAVQQAWYQLLADVRYSQDAHGSVVVDFKLYSDGKVGDAKIVQSSVDSIYSDKCRQAIVSVAPFAKWPPDMLQMFGNGIREVRFTFYYD